MAPQRRDNIGWLRKNPDAGKPVPGKDFNESDYRGSAIVDGKEWWTRAYITRTPPGEPDVLTTYYSEKKNMRSKEEKDTSKIVF